jgi:hypothetical protein
VRRHFPGGGCGTSHSDERRKTASSFFAQISAAIGELDWHLTSAREFVAGISGDEMRPNSVHLREDFLSPDDASRSDLEALETAKAEQDASHQKLDQFIAATLAELSGENRVP